MTRTRSTTTAAVTLALLAITASLAVNIRLALATATGAPTGPRSSAEAICIGLIVTGCGPRTSPLAFLGLLIVGALGALWVSRNLPLDEVDAAEEPASTELTHD